MGESRRLAAAFVRLCCILLSWFLEWNVFRPATWLCCAAGCCALRAAVCSVPWACGLVTHADDATHHTLGTRQPPGQVVWPLQNPYGWLLGIGATWILLLASWRLGGDMSLCIFGVFVATGHFASTRTRVSSKGCSGHAEPCFAGRGGVCVCVCVCWGGTCAWLALASQRPTSHFEMPAHS